MDNPPDCPSPIRTPPAAPRITQRVDYGQVRAGRKAETSSNRLGLSNLLDYLRLPLRAASTRFAAWDSAKWAGIDRHIALFARPFNGMGVQPFPVLEEGAKRQRDLAMLIAFGARRKCPGISQDVAPVFDQLRLAVERTILHRCTSNRRHDRHPYRLSVTG